MRGDKIMLPDYLVTIPPTLIKILAPLGPHFIRVARIDKQPVDKDWQNHPYSAEDQELQSWLKAGNNYGVLTGRGLTVVEVDSPQLKELAKKSLPETFTVQSPGSQGLHFYFLCSMEKNVPLSNPDDPKDNWGHIKAEGGQVLGPRSVHPNGNLYYIYKDAPLAQVTSKELREIFSPYMKNQELEDQAVKTASETQSEISILDVVPIKNLQKVGEDYIGPHPIHESSTGKNFHISTKKNVWYCFRCESGGGLLQWLAVQEGIIQCEKAKPGALKGELFKKVLDAARARGLKIPELKPNKPDSNDKIVEAVNHLVDKYHWKTIEDVEQILVYQDGIYVPGEITIKKELETLLGEEANIHLVNEVTAHIARKSYFLRSDFNKFTGQIPVQNGMLDLFTMKLEPFDPEKPFTFKIQAQYDINGYSPKFKTFLEQILPNEEDRKLIQQYLGYCLYPSLPFHKILFLYGTGRNGKGTLVRTIQDILGPINVAAIPLESFSGEQRFQVANLYGKLLNVCSEPATRETFNTETLKKVMGQDLINAEIKNKQNPLVFTSIAKFIVMGNRFPHVADRTLSWWDRILTVNFDKTFTTEQGTLIPDYEKQWLEDEQERSGILNWLIDGLTELINNKGFTVSKSQVDMEIQFKRVSDSVGAFIDEKCIIDSHKVVAKADLFAAYNQYCDECNSYNVGENRFGRRIGEQPRVIPESKTVAGKTIKYWVGIGFKTVDSKITDIAQITDFTTRQSLGSSIESEKNKSEKTVISIKSVISSPDEELIPVAPRVDPNLAHVINNKSCPICGKPIIDGERWTFYKGDRMHLLECYKMASEESSS